MDMPSIGQPVRLDVDTDWEAVKESLSPILQKIEDGKKQYKTSYSFPNMNDRLSMFISSKMLMFWCFQAGMVTAAASTMAAAANTGAQGIGVKGAKLLLDLNLQDFAKKVVTKMARENQATAAGKLNLAAVNMGAGSLVTQLSAALLCAGHVSEAVEITAAFWDAAEESGMEPDVAAASAAPAVVQAVDAGHAVVVAAVQKELLEKEYTSLVIWLTVAVAKIEGRPDVVAAGTWAAMQGPSGSELASNVAAMTMVEGHYDVAASSAGKLYDLAGEESYRVVHVLAAAAKQAVGVRQGRAVVAVSELLIAEGREALVASSVAWMVENGDSDVAGKISMQAVAERKFGLMQKLVAEMVSQGKTKAAAMVAGAMGKDIWLKTLGKADSTVVELKIG